MNAMEITKELKCDIELNQNRLKSAIFNHQNYLSKFKADPYNLDFQKEVNKAEAQIVIIGLEQKNLLERLRHEYRAYQKSVKTNVVKNGIEERRFNLTNALNRARKQNIAITRSSPVTSFSDESIESQLINSSPEHHQSPVEPHDITQSEFLTYFSLATHEVYKEMQNKRAERKRRSTANPHFLYGNKGWDFLTNNKRKRNSFLISPISPPHTRQSVKKKQERISPPLSVINHIPKSELNENSPVNQQLYSSFPTIPNLPSGLIIERVSPGCSSPDSKACITCKQPEKLKEKQQLEEKKQNLTAELSHLQNRHCQLTISLKNQKCQQDQLLTTQRTTEEKIKQILTFIDNIKKPLIVNNELNKL